MAEHRRRHSRAGRTWLFGVVLGVVVVGLVVGSLVIVIEVGPPVAASLRPLIASHVVVAPKPAITWPSAGEGAVAVPSSGVLRHSPTQTAVPIGSVAKIMTALQVLDDHPLLPGEDGPSVTVTDADVALWHAELGTDQSNVAIAAGEVLTERQLLEGLLVHSGNDYAVLLAVLDAGSLPAFVAKLNARAAAMGLESTHYADASGFDPGTVSTPAAQLVVATAAMAIPTFAEIVAMPAVTLPVAGTVTTYTPDDGTRDVVGVKSGLTTQAAGCDVLALDATVGGHVVQILSAVTGQEGSDRLADAGSAAYDLAVQAQASFRSEVIATTHAPVATLSFGHGTVPLVLHQDLAIPVWPRRTVRVAVVLAHPVTATIHVGDELGVAIATAGGETVREPVFAGGTLAPPTLLQRLM